MAQVDAVMTSCVENANSGASGPSSNPPSSATRAEGFSQLHIDDHSQNSGPSPSGGNAGQHGSERSFSALPGGAGVSGWGDLPIPLLSIIFDEVMTAPMPHPDYLKPKARSWSSICRVCRHWANAMHDTAIGVCLPANLPEEALSWLSKVLKRSSETLLGCIDAPYDGSWMPGSFPHLRTCAVHRAGPASSTFDMDIVKELACMEDLILASGFSHAANWSALPSSTQQVVWTCPGRLPVSGRPLTGHLTLQEWPETLKLDSLVLEADFTLQMDPTVLHGRVSRIALHAPYLFLSTPPPPGEYLGAEKTTEAIVQCIAQSLVDDRQLVDLNINCFSLFAGLSELADMDSNALSTGQPDIMEPLVSALQAAVRALPPSPSRPQLRVSRGHEGLELSLSRPPPDNDGSSAVLLSFDEPGALEAQLPQLLVSTTPVCSIAFMDFVPLAEEDTGAVHPTLQPYPSILAGPLVQLPPAWLQPAADVTALVGHVAGPSSTPIPSSAFPSSSTAGGTGGRTSAGCTASRGLYDGHAGSSSISSSSNTRDRGGSSSSSSGNPAVSSEGAAVAAVAAAATATAVAGGGGTADALQQLSHLFSMSSLAAAAERPGLAAEAAAQQALLTCRNLSLSSAHQLKEVTGLLLLPPAIIRALTGFNIPDLPGSIVSGSSGGSSCTHACCYCQLPSPDAGSSSVSCATARPQAVASPSLSVFRPLLSSYLHLSRVSMVTLVPLTERDILPPTVVMVDFRAGTSGQRFSADAISNLLDMHSLTLRGYHSLDLGRLPANVRSPNGGAGRGLTLNIWDTPASRTEPLGAPGTDVLPTPGPPSNQNNALSVCLARGSPMMGDGVPPGQPPLAVDLGAWGKVALDVHIQCAAGAVLHLPSVTDAISSMLGSPEHMGTGWPLLGTLETMRALEAVSPEGGGCLRTVSCQFAEDEQQQHVPTVQLAGRPGARLLDIMLFVHAGIIRNGWDVTGRRLHEQGAMLVTLRKDREDDEDDEMDM